MILLVSSSLTEKENGSEDLTIKFGRIMFISSQETVKSLRKMEKQKPY